VDAGAHVASSAVDGIHLDIEAHRELGVRIAERVRDLERAGLIVEPSAG
jgi:hypothetical protein